MGAVNTADRLPWHLWTRNGQFFVGCIWGVRINGEDVDLPHFADNQQVRGVEPGCKTKPLACAHPQCTWGVCEDRSVGFICDCTNTSYSGQLCGQGRFACNSEFVLERIVSMLCCGLERRRVDKLVSVGSESPGNVMSHRLVNKCRVGLYVGGDPPKLRGQCRQIPYSGDERLCAS